MEHHQTWSNKERQDWFDNREKHLNQKIYDSFAQHKHHKGKRDAYDYDPTSASPYDSGANINGGNAYGIKSPYTDNDTPIGPKEKDLIAALKKGYFWDKELEKELARPGGEGQADARAGYAGAIPKTKSGELWCEGVGANCEPHPEKSVDKEATDNLKEGPDKETIKAAEEITGEVETKKKKKEEKGEEPTGTPGDEEKESKVAVEPVKPKEAPIPKEAATEAPAEAAAFAQHRHHHKKHHHRRQ